MIDRCKEEGRLIGALAGKAQHAERHVNAGVDLIIAQGAEAGGHTGEVGTMVLIPEIVDAVGSVPVLGAGGIGRGRQMAAAMALGAQGVWCGSVWLTTEEAETHPVVKQKFLAATSSDTLRSRSRTGKPARQLRTAWTDEWDNPANPAPLGMPMQPILVGEALARIDRAAHRPGSGAEQLTNYFVGQIVGTMNTVKPAAQVVFDMIDEFIEAGGGAHLLQLAGAPHDTRIDLADKGVPVAHHRLKRLLHLVEIDLEAFQHLDHLRQLFGLVDFPVLLRSQANAGTVGTTAEIRTPEGAGAVPSRANQIAVAKAAVQQGGLEGRDLSIAHGGRRGR
jgi:hypothetical protein